MNIVIPRVLSNHNRNGGKSRKMKKKIFFFIFLVLLSFVLVQKIYPFPKSEKLCIEGLRTLQLLSIENVPHGKEINVAAAWNYILEDLRGKWL